mmetsp:Transcript_7052/g.9141  ORF Transcript_7052/g.9141 Transcript_7052/m.9141 type:complete len:221 (+) Transcript_7052:433-1095(+)
MMLEQDEVVVDKLLSLDEHNFYESLNRYRKSNSGIEGYRNDIFVNRMLKSTEWMIESGLKGVSAKMNRFKICLGITPCSEKTRYVFAKYLDSVMETKISSIIANSLNENRIDDDEMRQWALANDPKSRRYLIDAIRQYLDKHLLQSLPRVLTIWFLLLRSTMQRSKVIMLKRLQIFLKVKRKLIILCWNSDQNFQVTLIIPHYHSLYHESIIGIWILQNW